MSLGELSRYCNEGLGLLNRTAGVYRVCYVDGFRYGCRTLLLSNFGWGLLSLEPNSELSIISYAKCVRN